MSFIASFLFEQEKEKYLARGYEIDWGDGALNTDYICIMRKGNVVPIDDSPTKVRTEVSYVVISYDNRTVEFNNVESYNS